MHASWRDRHRLGHTLATYVDAKPSALSSPLTLFIFLLALLGLGPRQRAFIMADAANFRQRNRLSPDVTRVLYVRNLPFKLSSEELYDIFGKYGPIRQVMPGRPS